MILNPLTGLQFHILYLKLLITSQGECWVRGGVGGPCPDTDIDLPSRGNMIHVEICYTTNEKIIFLVTCKTSFSGSTH